MVVSYLGGYVLASRQPAGPVMMMMMRLLAGERRGTDYCAVGDEEVAEDQD